MRRRALLDTMATLASPLVAPAVLRAQGRQGPPHEWVFGAWTGGLFPPNDADTPACFGSPTVIFSKDVVMRASLLDTPYRQRVIETVALQPNGLEFRFLPAVPQGSAFSSRLPPDFGFGCGGSPDMLRVERRGPDEIVFPDCGDFPSPLRRCVKRP